MTSVPSQFALCTCSTTGSIPCQYVSTSLLSAGTDANFIRDSRRAASVMGVSGSGSFSVILENRVRADCDGDSDGALAGVAQTSLRAADS